MRFNYAKCTVVIVMDERGGKRAKRRRVSAGVVGAGSATMKEKIERKENMFEGYAREQSVSTTKSGEEAYPSECVLPLVDWTP